MKTVKECINESFISNVKNKIKVKIADIEKKHKQNEQYENWVAEGLAKKIYNYLSDNYSNVPKADKITSGVDYYEAIQSYFIAHKPCNIDDIVEFTNTFINRYFKSSNIDLDKVEEFIRSIDCVEKPSYMKKI